MSLRSFAVLFALAGAAACSGPTPPPPPPPPSPTVSCPASVTLESPDNVPMPVTFAVPTASGGQTPVSVTCSAQSGANFPLGSTLVTCTATDSLQRTGTCNFNVAVTPTPRISKTKFLAFGDSITVGQCGSLDCVSYDTRLLALLQQRYTRQTLTTTNLGVDGECAANDICTVNGEAGEDRLPRELSRDFEVLLLMEGTNDIFNAESITDVNDAEVGVERMVMRARQANKEVFLATIAPMRYPGSAGGKPTDGVGPFVPILNERIKAIASKYNAVLVDVYAALAADMAANISSDNLHPTDKGLQVIAETFYAAIRTRLDSTPTSASSLFRRR
jgi:lysophospholipase L1-like esterase